MPDVIIKGIKVAEGKRIYTTLPVTTMANGSNLEIGVHILNGKKSGPKILLSAGAHGDALLSIDILRRFMDQVDLDKLAGTIVAVPCMNPLAVEWQTRNTPHDTNNLNRVFPGSEKGWISNQMAAAVAPLCKECDYGIDWHGGRNAMGINYVLVSRAEGEQERKIKEMAFAFGHEYIYDGAPAGPAAEYSGTLNDYMNFLKKPCIVAEVGCGMPLNFDIISGAIRGAFNVLKKLEMYPGEIVLPKTQYLIKDRPLIRPKNGGLFYPECDSFMLNKTVPKGTLMSKIRNPNTLEVIEEIYAPCDQTVFLSMRGSYCVVHPGDYAYIVGDLSTATRIENH